MVILTAMSKRFHRVLSSIQISLEKAVVDASERASDIERITLYVYSEKRVLQKNAGHSYSPPDDGT